MPHSITVLPANQTVNAAGGDSLLSVLRSAGFIVDAPCGGDGRCGKCRVLLKGKEVLACRTVVDRDMTVTLPEIGDRQILTEGIVSAGGPPSPGSGYSLAFDIGTTTVVGYLLADSKVLASASAGNPQAAYGADVVSRIRLAVQGQQDALTGCIRNCLQDLTLQLCRDGGISPEQVSFVSVVGNPAMQQLFLNIPLENLAKVPFSPVLTEAKTVPAGDILPVLANARLLIVPDIAGFVGADTVACVLATGMDTAEEMTLLVDIGTNGEMVLGNRNALVACSAAAGPALEGAGIHFGMRGQTGAIDHVWVENGQMKCSVIGGGTAVGICGSGLIDGAAAALELGYINERGKILTSDGMIHLTEEVYLTQEDIRQLQLAKGAIAAGIRLMAAHLGIGLQEVPRVYLAGAFGTFMDPKSACRIGLLPAELEGKITAAGNAAGSGAKLLACDPDTRARVQTIAAQTQALELSTLPDFPKCFARNMRF